MSKCKRCGSSDIVAHRGKLRCGNCDIFLGASGASMTSERSATSAKRIKSTASESATSAKRIKSTASESATSAKRIKSTASESEYRCPRCMSGEYYLGTSMEKTGGGYIAGQENEFGLTPVMRVGEQLLNTNLGVKNVTPCFKIKI